MVPHVLSPGLRHAWRWALASLAVAACLTPTDPNAGRVAELRVRAAFAPGAEPDAMGVTVDTAVVVATPQDGGPAAVDTAVPVTDLAAALSWIVQLQSDSAPYDLQLDLRGGGRRLYTGETAVALRRLPLGDAPIHDVPVAYVGTGPVATLTVAPGTVTLTAAGATRALTADARDANGAIVTPTVTWSTSDAAVATVDPATGNVTAVATGVTTVTATADGVAGHATVTVALGGLFVEIAPVSATIPALGATHQFTAPARGGNGTTVNDAAFTWTTADAAVATVDATGLVTAVTEGTTLVSAETGGVTAEADVAVAVAATVEVSPAATVLDALGATQPFSAVARNVTGEPLSGVAFTWTSSHPEAATVDAATGLAAAVANGTTTITATAGNAAGSATLEVSQAVASFAVAPSSATLTALGATRQFTVEALDANGHPVTVSPTWSSTDPAVAAVDAAGLVTALAAGQTTVTARSGANTASADVLVAPGGLTVELSPAGATLTALGVTRQFTAVVRDGSGTPVPDATVTWTARNPTVTAVDDTGLVTALAEGTTWLVAAAGGEADSGEVIVAVATSVEVAPPSATLAALDATLTFAATARDASGAEIPGASFTWSSGDPAVAMVDPVTGTATAAANGTVAITARTGNAAGTADLTVHQAIAGIVVTPTDATLTAHGATQAFDAEARDANGFVVADAAFTWTTTDPAVATVDPVTGLATAAGSGSATISATTGTVSGSATLTVDVTTAADRATITAAPETVEANNDDPSIITVRLFDANGNPNTASDGIVRLETTLGDLTPVTDNGDGTYRAELRSAVAGVARVTGTLDDLPIADDALVEFVAGTGTVATVEVVPGSATLVALGAEQQFTAVALNAAGQIVSAGPVTWTATGGVVTIDPVSGLATAVANGAGAITATLQGISGTAPVTVAQAVTTVEVTPSEATLWGAGTTLQFHATARDANGYEVAGAAMTWTSSDTLVATVDGYGLATSGAAGRTTITASSGSAAGTARLRVCAATDGSSKSGGTSGGWC